MLTSIDNASDMMHPLEDFKAPKQLLYYHFSDGNDNEVMRREFGQCWRKFKKEYFVNNAVHSFENALRLLRKIANCEA